MDVTEQRGQREWQLSAFITNIITVCCLHDMNCSHSYVCEFRGEIARIAVKVCEGLRELHTGMKVSLRRFTKCILSSCKDVYLTVNFVHE